MANAMGHIDDGHGRSSVATVSMLPGITTAHPRRPSICLYSPSVDPSGMGAHMLDLATEFRSQADVSVLCWGTAAGQRVLDRAAALEVTAVHSVAGHLPETGQPQWIGPSWIRAGYRRPGAHEKEWR